ncbi:ICEBs1 excisionase [Bacillus amyloliquefaciens]|uniref:ICEBs1 excisionase n=1 Tax=Bacillus amyloliquefaciens TaxID=1390 RepID=UPI003C722090
MDDVQEILNVKRAKAYEIIRKLNKELEEEGYTTIKGRVSKNKFESSYLYKNIQGIG